MGTHLGLGVGGNAQNSLCASRSLRCQYFTKWDLGAEGTQFSRRREKKEQEAKKIKIGLGVPLDCTGRLENMKTI